MIENLQCKSQLVQVKLPESQVKSYDQEGNHHDISRKAQEKIVKKCQQIFRKKNDLRGLSGNLVLE